MFIKRTVFIEHRPFFIALCCAAVHLNCMAAKFKTSAEVRQLIESHIGKDGLLPIRLTPAARHVSLSDGPLLDGKKWLAASVNAPPEDGKANAALLKLLASATGRPVSQISIERGHTSRLKIVRIMDWP